MEWKMTTNLTRNRGLTLIELMITVAIASILIASATPNMTEFVQNNRAVTQINELQTSLNLARNEAIKRNNNITVCRSRNGASCLSYWRTDWQIGWIVFIDNDSDGRVDLDDGDQVLSVHGQLAGENNLRFSRTRVTYANSGLARGGSNGTFILCDARGTEKSIGVVVGPSGRPRFAKSSDISGFLADEGNADLACS
jgi:type IV fimbrial biogenesis protein FimT